MTKAPAAAKDCALSTRSEWPDTRPSILASAARPLDDGRNGYGAQPGSRLAGHGQGVARLEAAASVGVQETPGRSEGGVVFP